MRIEEIQNLDREGIIAEAQKQIRQKCGTFDAENFDRIKVFRKPGTVRVLFEVSVRFVPLDADELDHSYSAEVIFSDKGAVVHVFENLFVPSEASNAAAKHFQDVQLDDETTITIHEFKDSYEATVLRGLEGGGEGYKYEKATGKRSLLWHEDADPGLRTSIIGLGLDDTEEVVD